MPDKIDQKSLFSNAEQWCIDHEISYRKGSQPGEVIIACLKCANGRMFLYRSWSLCLACGHVSESFDDLDRLVKERTK